MTTTIEELAKSAIDLCDEECLKSLFQKHTFTDVMLNSCLAYAIDKKADNLVNLLLEHLDFHIIMEMSKDAIHEPISEPIPEPISELELIKGTISEPVNEPIKESIPEPIKESLNEVEQGMLELCSNEVVKKESVEKPDILTPLKEWVNEIFEKYCKLDKKYIKQVSVKKTIRKMVLDTLGELVESKHWALIAFLAKSDKFDYLNDDSVFFKMTFEQRVDKIDIYLSNEDCFDDFSGLVSFIMTLDLDSSLLDDNIFSENESEIKESFVELIVKNIDSIESWIE